MNSQVCILDSLEKFLRIQSALSECPEVGLVYRPGRDAGRIAQDRERKGDEASVEGLEPGSCQKGYWENIEWGVVIDI
jgi:hypothetical protein